MIVKKRDARDNTGACGDRKLICILVLIEKLSSVHCFRLVIKYYVDIHVFFYIRTLKMELGLMFLAYQGFRALNVLKMFLNKSKIRDHILT